MRGQGATEYLVLLAVVLIIALVSIALLGFFPGMATDAKITQSNSYWRGDANPFGILESSFQTDGVNANVTIVLVSNEAGVVMRAQNVWLSDIAVNWSTNDIPYTFAPGESHKIIGNYQPTDAPRIGMVYDVPVKISYTSGNGVNGTQYGSKNLVGKYV